SKQDQLDSPQPAVPTMATAASSATTCPICLNRLNNAAFVNPCLHQFCFGCVQRWSNTKAECPLSLAGMV
uniref:RING-type E3 ubiquitin transferase n=1 Tax=Dromaius novaehollandiae TaxID=8790 RepID=A0A8C4KCZ0_DRONO